MHKRERKGARKEGWKKGQGHSGKGRDRITGREEGDWMVEGNNLQKTLSSNQDSVTEDAAPTP
jgi:hypothetical protein